jgi:hypothetical protein
MKTKIRIILVSFFLTTAFFCNAQDATLEETIDWLSEYGLEGNIKTQIAKGNKLAGDINIEWTIDKKSTTHFEFTYIRYWKKKGSRSFEPSCSDREKYSIFEYSDLNSVQLKDDSVELKFNYDAVKARNSSDSCTYGSLKIVFQNNKDKATSLFKALKHLNNFRNADIKFINLSEIKNKF